MKQRKEDGDNSMAVDLLCFKCSLSTRRNIIRLIVDIIIWIIVGLPILLLYKAGKPRRAGFFCNDDSLRYPYKHDTISDTLLLAFGFSIPFSTMLLIELVRCLSSKNKTLVNKDMLVFVKGSLVFVFGFTITEIFIQGFKFSVGRLRPHFFDVCKPDFSSINCTQGYITDYICTDTEYSEKIHRESRQSFLSGHAAFSMYGAIYTSLYIEKRVHLTFSKVFKPVLQLAMVVTSSSCSLTRYLDHKHYVSDIIAGLFVGFCVAVFINKSIAEKFLQGKQPALNLPRFHKPVVSGEPRTPTPLLLRQDSSFTCLSTDSRDLIPNGHTPRRTDAV